MRSALLAAFLITLFSWRAPAQERGDSALCQHAIASAERLSGVPDELLDAISRVESGRTDEIQHAVRAWPWTVNEEGNGHFYNSKAEAVQAVEAFRARGIQSIDVGCTQINLMYHPNAFASIEDAFDPSHNATYAARFLTDLFHQFGSWPHAAAAYHSQTPELGTDYQRRVLQAWANPIDQPDPASAPGQPSSAHSNKAPHQFASNFTSPSRLFGMAPSVATRSVMTPVGAVRGSFGGIERSAGAPRFAFTGRTLSAYRATPVAMLRVSPPVIRY